MDTYVGGKIVAMEHYYITPADEPTATRTFNKEYSYDGLPNLDMWRKKGWGGQLPVREVVYAGDPWAATQPVHTTVVDPVSPGEMPQRSPRPERG
jgi:hypothetical protein